MALGEYLDFDLTLESGADGNRVVVDSPAGQAVAGFELPFSREGLELAVLKLGKRPTPSVRRVGTSLQDLPVQLGHQLYTSVFRGDVETCFRVSRESARASGKGLRIRLRIRTTGMLDPTKPALADVPWEYLYDESRGLFLALARDTPVVRFVDLPSAPEPLVVSGPLELLVVVSHPNDVMVLDVDNELQKLRSATQASVAAGRMRLTVLEDARLSTLQRTLRQGEYHVLHYIGHGGYEGTPGSGDGVLALEGADGNARLVNGRTLGIALHNAPSLRLTVLNSCEGSRASVEDPFSGVAQSLLRAGMPAVVAMQFEISDEAAISFAEEFYLAITEGMPVDAASVEARLRIFADGDAGEWATPVLYLRSHDARLFDVGEPAAMDMPARPSEPTPQEIAAPSVLVVPLGPGEGGDALDGPAGSGENVPSQPAGNLGAASAEPTGGAGDGGLGGSGAGGGDGGSGAGGGDGGSGAGGGDGGGREPPTTWGNSDLDARRPPAPTIVAPHAPGPPWWERTTGKVTAGATAAAAVVGLVAGVINLFPAGDERGGTLGQLGETPSIASSDQPTPDTSPTATSPSATASPTRTPPATPQGRGGTGDATLHATRVDQRPIIDGDASDWQVPVSARSTHAVFVAAGGSASPVTAQWRLAWTDAALFVLVDVRDRTFVRAWDGPSQIFRGDGVSLELGPDATDTGPNDPLRRGDRHVLLGPVDQRGEVVAAANIPSGNGRTFVNGPNESLRTDIAARASSSTSGYVVEAAIPWSVAGVTPGSGVHLAANLNVSDGGVDAQGRRTLLTMISTNPERTAANQPRPGRWQRLVLDG